MNKVDEGVENVTVCVEVCEGVLKRDANFTVNFENGTAFCKFEGTNEYIIEITISTVTLTTPNAWMHHVVIF